jgi:hypothetical protein
LAALDLVRRAVAQINPRGHSICKLSATLRSDLDKKSSVRMEATAPLFSFPKAVQFRLISEVKFVVPAITSFRHN